MSVADNFSSELFSWGWFPQCGRDFEIKSKLCWTWILVTINFTHNVFQVRLNRTDWYRTGKKSRDERFLLFNLSRKLLIWCSQTQLIRLKPQVVYSWIKIHVTGEMWHKITSSSLPVVGILKSLKHILHLLYKNLSEWVYPYLANYHQWNFITDQTAG